LFGINQGLVIDWLAGMKDLSALLIAGFFG
jgi:hypothetical protein